MPVRLKGHPSLLARYRHIAHSRILSATPVYVTIVQGVHSSPTLIPISHRGDHDSTAASFQNPTVFWPGSSRAERGQCSGNHGTQTTEDHDEERLGIGRPDESGLSLLTRACACRSRA